MKRFRAAVALSIGLLSVAAPAVAREFTPAVKAVEDMVAAGRNAEAQTAILAILARAEAARDDLAIAEASGSLGGVLVGLGDMKGAEAPLKRAWTLREARLGPNHPQTLFAINDYGVWMSVQGRDAEAEPLFARVVAGLEADPKTDPGDIADARIGHAMTLFKLGAWQAAESEMLAALPIAARTPGKEVAHLSGLTMLADGYMQWGRYADGRRVALEALAVSERQLGKDHPNHVGILVLLGQANLNLGDQAAAEAAYQRGVQIAQAGYPQGGIFVEHGLLGLAGYYSVTQRRAEAVDLYARVAASQEASGDRTWRAGESLRLMAENLTELGRGDEALDAARKAIAIADANRGPESDMAGMAHMTLARVAYDRKDLVLGEAEARRSLAIFEKVLTPDNPRIGDAVGLVAFAANRRGDHAEAARLYARAVKLASNRAPYHPALTSGRGLYAQELLLEGDPAAAWAVARLGATGAQDRVLANGRMIGREGAPSLTDADRTTFMVAVRSAWALAEEKKAGR